ncbi:MAG: hypothetical protein J6W87_03780 [Clostridia bacterium]|nr:hypothetical protein [Clostridia bacterium]
MLFKRGYTLTLNRVHDTLTVKEGDARLTLTVDGDSMRMVAGINKAQEKMNAILKQEKPAETDIREAADFFAPVIFGAEGSKKLFDFYNGDAGCVISVCGQYFKGRLADKIAKIQRRLKV